MLTIEPIDQRHLPAVRALLADYPFLPHAYLASVVGLQPLSRLGLAHVEASLADETAGGLLVSSSEGPKALAVWRFLPWDSQQLGFVCARLEHIVLAGDYSQQQRLGDLLLPEAIRHCSAKGVRYLWARLDSSNLSALHLLERHGFLTVDGILTFALRLDQAVVSELLASRSAESAARVRPARPEDRQRLVQLARSAYEHDRFHSDPLIPRPVADEVYALWMENACQGTAADVVLVAEQQGRVQSYVTALLDREAEQYLGLRVGNIALVGTAADARGQGLAQAAMQGTLAWFREHGVQVVEVGTQLRNVPAARLYEGLGFRLVATSISLRHWLG